MLAVASLQWPLGDFVEYWAAGRLMNTGGNPYDAAAMLREQRQVGLTRAQPIMMYNPPWTLVLAMPAAALNFALARSAWLLFEILTTLWSASRLWGLYGGPPRHRTLACYLALLWMPTIMALNLGQVSPLLLVGLVGFVESIDARRDKTAGAYLSLTAVKPQIVALVWAAVILWSLQNRRWKVLAAAGGSIAAASLAVALMNPGVFAQYHHLMVTAPPTMEFESPNLATALRLMIGTERNWPQFIPTFIGGLGVALLLRYRRQRWDWSQELPLLVLLSCLVTSYGGWPFDLIVLLIPVIATAAAVVRSGRRSLIVYGASAFLTISLVALTMHQALVPQSMFVWMTPIVLLVFLGLRRGVSQDTQQDSSRFVPA